MVSLNGGGRAALALLFAFALLAPGLAGCRKEGGGTGGNAAAGGGSATAGGKMRVGFSQTEEDGPWRIASSARIP